MFLECFNTFGSFKKLFSKIINFLVGSTFHTFNTTADFYPPSFALARLCPLKKKSRYESVLLVGA